MHSAVKIAKCFVDKANASGHNSMTVMKLLKLVYIAHGWTLALCDKQLISEDVEAWKYGPVVPELYREIKSWRGNNVTKLPDEWFVDLSDSEESIVEQVFQGYNKFSGIELSSMTHAEGTPWHRVWNETGCSVIHDEIIREYYKNLSEQHD